MSKLLFKKGTQLYIETVFDSEGGTMLMPAPNMKLEEDFETERPQKDYASTIMGPQEIPVSENTSIHYKDQYYLKAGDASNFNTNTAKEVASNTLNKIRDFFYEEVPHSHEETDEDGNTITVEDGTIRQMNWFKVGACTTSITLMILGAIIMFIRKHK